VYEYVYRFVEYVYGVKPPNAGRQPRAVFSRIGWTGLCGSSRVYFN
jgi:hypothetical protein